MYTNRFTSSLLHHSVVSPPFAVETTIVASLLAIELPSVVSPPFAVETPTVASWLAIEHPSVVSPPFAVETPAVSVLYSHKESILELRGGFTL